MSSNAAVISPVGLQRFTLFSRLPPEIRVLIWRLSLSSRIVEIIASDRCNGFYSQAALPTALQVCRESRQSVETLYPLCFGSFLQPERIRFNFEIDILYMDTTYCEEELSWLFGILKESELRKLKYFAIDHEYFHAGRSFPFMELALKRALIAMTDLKEMVVILEFWRNPGHPEHTKVRSQMNFYAEHDMKATLLRPCCHLPMCAENYKDWKLSDVMKITTACGQRTNRKIFP